MHVRPNEDRHGAVPPARDVMLLDRALTLTDRGMIGAENGTHSRHRARWDRARRSLRNMRPVETTSFDVAARRVGSRFTPRDFAARPIERRPEVELLVMGKNRIGIGDEWIPLAGLRIAIKSPSKPSSTSVGTLLRRSPTAVQ